MDIDCLLTGVTGFVGRFVLRQLIESKGYSGQLAVIVRRSGKRSAIQRFQEEMNTLNAEIRQRRTQAKALREVILRIMETNNLAQLNISKGAVVHETREIKGSMSADYIARHCKDFFNGDEAKASALMAYLNEHRETKVKHDLKLRPSASETGSNHSR